MWVKRDNFCLPWPKVIVIHGSSFRDLIPSLRLRRIKRLREVTKFCIAIGDKATLCVLLLLGGGVALAIQCCRETHKVSHGFLNHNI